MRKSIRAKMQQVVQEYDPANNYGRIRAHIDELCKKYHIGVLTFYRYRRKFIKPDDARYKYMMSHPRKKQPRSEGTTPEYNNVVNMIAAKVAEKLQSDSYEPKTKTAPTLLGRIIQIFIKKW